MPLKECPHCLSSTFIGENADKWPCCGKLTLNNPKENIEITKHKRAKEEIESIISHTTKVVIVEMTGGISILVLIAALTFFITFSNNIVWKAGLVIGVGLLLKGFIDIKDLLQIKEEYKMKYCNR